MKSEYSIIENKLNRMGLELITNKENFQGTNFKVSLKCLKGHIFLSKTKDVLDSRRINRPSRGCPECAKIISFESSYIIAKSQLQEGYQIISYFSKFVERSEQKNILTFIIQCDKGHEYEREAGRIHTHGCPECTKTTFVGQERVRAIFEQSFNKKFPSIRPEWLKYPLTNRKLELDGYNEELKLAFEYQGRQHFSNDTEFGGDYHQQVLRDNFKHMQCKSLGIKLIIIEQPRSYSEVKFIKSVYEDCLKQGLTLPIVNYAFNHINDNITMQNNYENFKEYVEDKKYTLISDSFSTMEDSLDFQCSEGHIFKMTGLNFKNIYNTDRYREEACVMCFAKNHPQKSNSIINLVEAKNIAKEHGLILLSNEYINVNTLMSWSCQNGHHFQKTLRHIQRNKTGNYCTECEPVKKHTTAIFKKDNNISIETVSKTGEVRNVQWLTEFSHENGCELLDGKYLGMDEKHHFRCNKGHEFISSVTNIVEKKQRNTAFCLTCSDVNVVSVESVRDFVKDKNIVCLSAEYKNVNTMMNWQCKNHHHFEKTFRQIQRNKTGKYCPHCH